MRRTPGINVIAGCRVEKALIINNYGKLAARFSPCVGVDDRRMKCIHWGGVDRGDDRSPFTSSALCPSHTRMICTYVRAYAYFCIC